MIGLTGCMAYDTKVEITGNDTATIGFQVVVDKEEAARQANATVEDLSATVKEQMGTDTPEFTEHPAVNYEFKETDKEIKVNVSIEVEYSTAGMMLPIEIRDMDGVELFTESVNVRKSDEGEATVSYNLIDFNEASWENVEKIYSDVTFKVKFPGDILEISTGGKSEDGVASWDLKAIKAAVENGDAELTVSGTTNKNLPIIPMILIFLLVVAATGGFFLYRMRKRNSSNNTDDDIKGMDFSQQYDPQYNQQGYGQNYQGDNYSQQYDSQYDQSPPQDYNQQGYGQNYQGNYPQQYDNSQSNQQGYTQNGYSQPDNNAYDQPVEPYNFQQEEPYNHPDLNVPTPPFVPAPVPTEDGVPLRKLPPLPPMPPLPPKLGD